ALCSQFSGFSRVMRRIRVCPNLESAVLVRPSHNPSELAFDGGIHGGNYAVINTAGGTVQGNPVSLVVFLSCQGKSLVGLIHGNIAAAGYTAGAHSTGHHSRMAGHAA